MLRALATTETEVERFVRDQLYGGRATVAATTAAGPRPPRPSATPGRLVGSRYRLLERVGAGGMATVYRARDERLGREVAVKVIAPHLGREARFVRHFRREAELCARVAHPNVVAVLDMGVEPRDFIVMEFVDGVDLGRMLHRSGRLSAARAISLAIQICDALERVHGGGLLHHDVSPGNVLLRDADGAAKLADFGLAASASDSPPADPSAIAGTPGYIAPELLLGEPASPRSDIYSLGMVVHRALAGRAAPPTTVPMATAVHHPPPLAAVCPGLPQPLSEVVDRATAHEPGTRPASAAELRAALEEAAAPQRLELTSAA